ncbi:hypothetical protein ABC347_09155 [Sphingomonas sp. 1P06PA]|uniref:hypothetical protein n=1 Tax=Sphingomonas sp. 1P06PA TaxID=554121 RepID=UPI0039A4633A
MSAATMTQIGLLQRLRDVRLRSAQAALATARARSAEAARAQDEAAEEARAAERARLAKRDALFADPGEAERRLALLEIATVDQAAAAEREQDAMLCLTSRLVEEGKSRAVVLSADARVTALATRAAEVRRTLNARDEERAAIEAEEARR